MGMLKKRTPHKVFRYSVLHNKIIIIIVGSSPSGVNRRTAVLFTRKAQAALKKPEANKP